MMNPPFSLKRGDEKEYKFLDHALLQLEHGGLLFSVLPYSSMVRPGAYKVWRRDVLLAKHSLRAVVTFPIDLFYPVGVTTVGVLIRKGTPHQPTEKVLWARALNDGLLKSKGRRLPHPRATDDLAAIRDTLRSFLRSPDITVENQHQLLKASPIDFGDRLVELVPEAYLDQATPTPNAVAEEAGRAIRDLLAVLIKTGDAQLKPELLGKETKRKVPSHDRWSSFNVTEIFNLMRGDFHSIANLDPGRYPTISRVSTDCGLVGFHDRPNGAKIHKPGTITISTVSGDAFLQPTPFIATDNVLLCIPKREFGRLRLTSLFFIQLMLNEVKWRWSYGRQPYIAKFATTQIRLPTTANGKVDEDHMAAVMEAAPHWGIVMASINYQQDRMGIET